MSGQKSMYPGAQIQNFPKRGPEKGRYLCCKMFAHKMLPKLRTRGGEGGAAICLSSKSALGLPVLLSLFLSECLLDHQFSEIG